MRPLNLTYSLADQSFRKPNRLASSTFRCIWRTNSPGGRNWTGSTFSRTTISAGCWLSRRPPSSLTIIVRSDRNLREFYGTSSECIAQRRLRARVSFLTKCSLVLSQDSGPRHMGNAAGISIVYARNIRVSALETGSYLDTEHDVVPPQVLSGNFSTMERSACVGHAGAGHGYCRSRFAVRFGATKEGRK